MWPSMTNLMKQSKLNRVKQIKKNGDSDGCLEILANGIIIVGLLVPNLDVARVVIWDNLLIGRAADQKSLINTAVF